MDFHTTLDILATHPSPSRKIYWYLIEKNLPPKTATSFLWQKELGVNWTSNEWSTFFVNFLRDVKPTKLRFLQYHILNRALTTNVLRSKWNTEISPLCTFCSQQKETVLHVLAECTWIKPLWNALERFCKYYLAIDLVLDNHVIIMNNYKGKHRAFVNLFISTMKQHLYASKCKEQLPTFLQFVEKLSYWYHMDRTYAWQK